MGVTGYFDASGHPDSEGLLVVSGFLSSDARWERFERLWNEALEEAGIGVFHMRDFAQSTGEFGKWKSDEEKRKNFLAELIEIIVNKAAVFYSAAGAVVVNDWHQCNRDYRLAESELQPYSLGGWLCVNEVRCWCKEQGRSFDKVRFVFEDGDKDKGHLIARLKHDFGVIVETAKKREVRALEAADFAAWNIRKVLTQAESGPVPRLRRDFEELMSRIPSYGHQHMSMTAKPTPSGTYRAPSLKRFCDLYHVAKRG
jgi:hypothetical protein